MKMYPKTMGFNEKGLYKAEPNFTLSYQKESVSNYLLLYEKFY